VSPADASPLDLPREEPSWLYPRADEQPLSHAAAAEFLTALEEEDFSIFVLAYGLGMRFGGVAQTLGLDPALVVWRLRRALERWRREADDSHSPRALEAGLTALLRAEHTDAPAPPRELPSWKADDLVAQLTSNARARLSEQLAKPQPAGPVRPGVGIGLAVVILVAAVGLVIYGAERDKPPLLEGRRLLELGRYTEARAEFMRLGNSVEGRKWRALSYVAEGEFEHAFGFFSEVDVLASLGQFAPHERPIAPLPDPGTGNALLPRGTIRSDQPQFVFNGPISSEIRLRSIDGAPRSFRSTLDQAEALEADVVRYRVSYPRDQGWEKLGPGQYEWSLVGDPGSRARFEVISPARRSSISSHFTTHIPDQISSPTKRFLLAQFFLNQGLLMDAAIELGHLTRAFPSATYPARRLADVCAALGVDPSAFAR